MGKLGLKVQPSTLAHQALVASGAELASSVCVIQPERPGVGTCFSRAERGDFVLGRFLGDRFAGCFVFFFMAVEIDGSRRI